MVNKDFYTVAELAAMLGISRVAVFNKIKKNQIVARKIGRNFVIAKDEVDGITGQALSASQKKDIEKAVSRIVKEYGPALKMLGDT